VRLTSSGDKISIILVIACCELIVGCWRIEQFLIFDF